MGILAFSLTDISKSTKLPAQFGDPGTDWHYLRLLSGNSPRSKKHAKNVIWSHLGSLGYLLSPKLGILVFSFADVTISTQLQALFGDPGTDWHYLRLFSGNSSRSKKHAKNVIRSHSHIFSGQSWGFWPSH